MKPRCAVTMFVCLLPLAPTTAQSADWMLRVQTMGRVCHVQLTTAAPIGADFKGPFSTRKGACQEAAVQYDVVFLTLRNAGPMAPELSLVAKVTA
jgi:hypothetical protein